jgi:hypothetical protein
VLGSEFPLLFVPQIAMLSFRRAPGDNTRIKDSVEYYTWLAKLAEKGKITCIFFADVYGGTFSANPSSRITKVKHR